MKYQIISKSISGTTTISDFEDYINKRIKNGWRCQGGVIMLPPTKDAFTHLVQAMIKDDHVPLLEE